MYIESVSGLEKEFKEEDDPKVDKELEVEDPELLDEEDKEENEEEPEEEKEEKVEIPQYKEIAEKYPKFFKDFPNLRHAFFHAKEYRELFPSIEEAKEAVQEVENLRELETALSSGKAEDLIGVLNSIKELGDEVVPNFAINFLPSIKKVDQDLYYQVLTPEFVNLTRTVYDAGLRGENDNLKNAALVVALHLFGDPKVASGEREVKLPSPKTLQTDDKLDKERKAFQNERYTTLYNDVIDSSDNALEKAILDGLDPKEEMSDGMKELITEKVVKEITKTLASSSIHTSRMNSLWTKASKENFSTTHKGKIVAAYLGAAKEIMPKIRAKVRANILGIRDRHPENNGGERTKRIEPKANAGGGRQSNSNGKNLDAKKIDWNKTSDLDLIRDNVTLKS